MCMSRFVYLMCMSHFPQSILCVCSILIPLVFLLRARNDIFSDGCYAGIAFCVSVRRWFRRWFRRWVRRCFRRWVRRFHASRPLGASRPLSASRLRSRARCRARCRVRCRTRCRRRQRQRPPDSQQLSAATATGNLIVNGYYMRAFASSCELATSFLGENFIFYMFRPSITDLALRMSRSATRCNTPPIRFTGFLLLGKNAKTRTGARGTSPSPMA
jgi:hypothetical protein